jgi:hypothetical protein
MELFGQEICDKNTEFYGQKSNNGTVRFEKCKHLLEFRNFLLLRDTYLLVKSLINI